MHRVRNSPRWLRLLVGVLIVAIVLVGVYFYLFAQRSRAAPEQPIAFNHLRMVGSGIPCLYCHYGTTKGPAPVIPSTQWCMGCHNLILLIIIGFFTPMMLLVFLSLPMFFRLVLPMYRHPRPAERPENWPADIWPLWFVASAFGFSRRFGMLFLVGLILDTILRLWILPLFG